jgi:hypothetical protein
MPPTVIAEDLRAHRAVLAARLQETEAELRRVNAALLAVDGDPNSTLDLLRACVVEVGEVDAREALTYLVAHGWQADARGNPLNTVRTALAHLATWGEIERVSRGVYRVAGEMADAG